MAKGLLEVDALQTAFFIDRINSIWDLMNSAQMERRGPKSPISVGNLQQRKADLLHHADWVNQWKFRDCRGVTRICLPVKEGLVKTLRGMADIVSYLIEQQGFAYVRTRRFNTDHLENLFCQIRAGRGNANNHPEPWQAICNLRIASLAMSLSTSTRANCADDGDQFFAPLPDPEPCGGK